MFMPFADSRGLELGSACRGASRSVASAYLRGEGLMRVDIRSALPAGTPRAAGHVQRGRIWRWIEATVMVVVATVAVVFVSFTAVVMGLS